MTWQARLARTWRQAAASTTLLALMACDAASEGKAIETTAAVNSVGAIAATIPVGPRPLPLAGGFGSIWVRNGDGEVQRIDVETNSVVATIEVGGGPYGYLVAGEGAVWVSGFDDDSVSRIDPATNSVVAEIEVGSAPEGVGVTPGAIWVANHHDGTVSRIDPATNRVVATITLGREGPSGPLVVAAGQDGVWVNVPNSGDTVFVIDPVTNAVSASYQDCYDGIALGIDGAWLACSSGIVRVATGAEDVLWSPIHGEKLAYGGGSVWVREAESIIRIDAGTGRTLGELEVGGTGELTYFDEALWYGNESAGLVRISPSP